MHPENEKFAHEKSVEHEFYSPILKGYKKGKTKYIIITGSVMSGVGKGTFSGCLATLLTCHGLKVSPIKFDGYLNYDAGTLNPFRHGEVFVLEDGTECDLDLGSYERYLNRNLTKDNYLTGGKIFKTIIDKERSGQYLGRDVQFIPHVVCEIKNFLRELAVKTDADIVSVEVGGTVGDLENSYFIEAMRELKYEEGSDNVCFINVTYIVEPGALGEHKSKPAQLGIRTLMGLGVQPCIIICRSENPVSESIKEKISIFSDVPVDRVYNLYDMSNVYEIPLILKDMGVDKAIFEIFNIGPKKTAPDITFSEWKEFVDKIKKSTRRVTIGIVGKYTNVHDSYLSILKAIEHAAPYHGVKPEIKWVEATDIEDGKVKVADALKGIDGIIVPGGFGERGVEGKIMSIQYTRENNIPFLGLCYGLQLAVIEFARNVCGFKDAHTTEINPKTKHPVVDFLPWQKKLIEEKKYGATMRLGGQVVLIKKGTLAHKLYDKDKVIERFRHRYEVNPEYIKILEKNGLVFSGRSLKEQDVMQIMELPNHKFFISSQFHPELTSRPLRPNPLFDGFIKACSE
jgi:CTP synthase